MFSVCSTNIFSFVLNTRRMMTTTHWSAKTWCSQNGWRNFLIIPNVETWLRQTLKSKTALASGGRVLLVLVGCFIQFLPSIYFLHIYIAVRYFMWRGARLSLHLHLLHRPGLIITDIGLINCFADQQQTFLQPDTSYKLSYLETLSSFWSAPTQPHHNIQPVLPMNGNIQYPSPDLWTLGSSSLIMPFH